MHDLDAPRVQRRSDGIFGCKQCSLKHDMWEPHTQEYRELSVSLTATEESFAESVFVAEGQPDGPHLDPREVALHRPPRTCSREDLPSLSKIQLEAATTQKVQGRSCLCWVACTVR